jgi:hypothetical protein
LQGYLDGLIIIAPGFFKKNIYANHTSFALIARLEPAQTPQVDSSSNSILIWLTVTWADAHSRWADIQVILDRAGAIFQVFAGDGHGNCPREQHGIG